MKSSLQEPESAAPASVLQFQITDTLFDVRDIGMQHILDILVCKPVFVESIMPDCLSYLINQSDSPVRILVNAHDAHKLAVFHYLYDIRSIVKQPGNPHYKFFFRKSHLFYQEFPVS